MAEGDSSTRCSLPPSRSQVRKKSPSLRSLASRSPRDSWWRPRARQVWSKATKRSMSLSDSRRLLSLRGQPASSPRSGPWRTSRLPSSFRSSTRGSSSRRGHQQPRSAKLSSGCATRTEPTSMRMHQGERRCVHCARASTRPLLRASHRDTAHRPSGRRSSSVVREATNPVRCRQPAGVPVALSEPRQRRRGFRGHGSQVVQRSSEELSSKETLRARMQSPTGCPGWSNDSGDDW